MVKKLLFNYQKITIFILNGRNINRLNEVRNLCYRKNKQIIWQQDLNEVKEIEVLLIDFIKTNEIEIDKYVHCAGYMKMAPLKFSSLNILSKSFNTNVISASLICKVLTNRKANNGALLDVVFISSNISNMGAME